MKKTNIWLTEQATMMTNNNGELCGYEAYGLDSEKNAYHIIWEVLEDFDMHTDDDESHACDWDYPAEVYKATETELTLDSEDVDPMFTEFSKENIASEVEIEYELWSERNT